MKYSVVLTRIYFRLFLQLLWNAPAIILSSPSRKYDLFENRILKRFKGLRTLNPGKPL